MVMPRNSLCRIIAVASLWVLAGTSTAADSFRCDGQIIETGDRALRVETLCGPPSLVENRPVSSVYGYAHDGTQTWTYNFGPRKLVRVLTFRNGRVADIASDGYGFVEQRDSRAAQSKKRCNPYDLTAGLSSYRVLELCGPPDDRQQINVLVPLSKQAQAAYPHLGKARQRIQREHWLYNFGSDHLLRTVVLENGRVVDVDVGERGFGP